MAVYEQYSHNATLCTVADFRLWQQDGQNSAQYDNADEAQQLRFIRQASGEIINGYLKRLPLPYLATLNFNAVSDRDSEFYFNQDLTAHVDEFYQTLFTHMRGDLLAVTSLTNGDGTVLTTSDYKLRAANSLPAWCVRILDSSSQSWTYDDDPQDAITLDGEWGYVPHYGNHWVNSTRVIPTGGITSSATTFTMDTPAHAGSFSAGDYIRVNSEVMQVTSVAVDASFALTGVITVLRGVLGTTAAAHLAGATIERFEQHSDIALACAEHATFLYKQKDKTGSEIVTLNDGVTIVRGIRPNWMTSLKRHRNRG